MSALKIVHLCKNLVKFMFLCLAGWVCLCYIIKIDHIILGFSVDLGLIFRDLERRVPVRSDKFRSAAAGASIQHSN